MDIVTYNPISKKCMEESYEYYKRFYSTYKEKAYVYALLYALYVNKTGLEDKIFNKNTVHVHSKFKNQLKRNYSNIGCKEKKTYLNDLYNTIDTMALSAYAYYNLCADNGNIHISSLDIFYLLQKNESEIFRSFFSSKSKKEEDRPTFLEEIIEETVLFTKRKLELQEADLLFSKERENTSFLDKIGAVDENENHRDKNPWVGEEKSLIKLEKMLITGNSVLILGSSGVGKTTLVKGLAHKLAIKDVPDCLKRKKILSIDTNNLISGARYRGVLEENIKELLDYAKKNKDIILFFDEAHTLASGKSNDGDVDIANMIKPSLSNQDIQIIGATTFDEWDESLAGDVAFRRRFKTMTLEKPNEKQLISIAMNYKIAQSERMQITFSADREFFEALIKHTKKEDIKQYETIKNPDLALSIIDDVFANALYKEHKSVLYEDIKEAIEENEVLNIASKKAFLLELDKLNYPRNEERKSKSKIIKFKNR